MSIDISGPYSPDTIYGQLTMPFVDKPVHINAHTPLDEESGKTVLTKNSFYNNLSDSKVSIEEIRDMDALELDESLKTDIGIKVAAKFPPENALPAFQSSSYLEGSGVVYSALQNGYPADRAIVIGHAFHAYQNSIKADVNPVQNLLSRNYQVS